MDMDACIVIVCRLLAALLIGSMIGLERAYRGRLAGLRTHTLVCASSCLLMLVTVYLWDFIENAPLDSIRVDPTRMAQGIMTGIGFLGAGVIMKERFSVRGLTTAASIWITASIGISIGLGFYLAAISSALLTLVVLSVFAWFERRLPTQKYSNLMIRMKRDELIKECEIYKIIEKLHIKGSNLSYHLMDDGRFMQYEFTICTNDSTNFKKLNETLCGVKQINEYRIIPMGS